MEHVFVNINGLRLHCRTAGSGDQLILLLHGYPEGWFAWRRVIEPLAAEGYLVAAPDLRGYNRSSAPKHPDNYQLEHLVEDVRQLIEHFGERATLIGHDWGALLAWLTAYRHPEIVERLIVSNVPNPFQIVRAERRNFRQALRSWFRQPTLSPALAEWRFKRNPDRYLNNFIENDNPAFNRPLLSPEDRAQYRRAFTETGTIETALNYYRAFSRHALGPYLNQLNLPDRKLRLPVLLFWGRHNRFYRREIIDGLEDYCARRPIIAFCHHCGYWLHHERPEWFLSEVRAFIKRSYRLVRFNTYRITGLDRQLGASFTELQQQPLTVAKSPKKPSSDTSAEEPTDSK